MSRLPKAARMLPPSTAANPAPGRMPHWVRANHTERMPVRWMVADSEAHRRAVTGGEEQTLRCAAAQFWRTDMVASDGAERGHFTDGRALWQWVVDRCHPHGRTCLAWHNASYDLALTGAFEHLPALGCELVWCNLDRDVSTASWKTPNGTLVIWDTYTWLPQSLDSLAPLTGITKPKLPPEDGSAEAWWARCDADVDITTACVKGLLEWVRRERLGNWQPSGAGMGHTTWRHRHYTHKVLVHDDGDALAAEREAMHTGRAEAWWHGKAPGGPFTEWDMRNSYTAIAAECDLPAKLWAHDPRPPARVHEWALAHWRVLANATVTTELPIVPCRLDGRITWPVGTFTTWLWDTELALLREEGQHYQVHEQYRYSRKPVLQSWANWTLGRLAAPDTEVPDLVRVWVKHQARAVIGRMALRTPTWEPYCENWMPWYNGISLLSEAGQPTRRLMHVGRQVWMEGDRGDTRQSVPQLTSWIMAEARSRLWRAARAAGIAEVVHTDTDAIITTAAGTAALTEAVHAGLAGSWRPKATWRTLDITGPRHYRAPGRRQIPGVPKRATETSTGTLVGEVWDSLAHALSEGRHGQVTIHQREYHPRKVDHRRPWSGEENGPALPIRVGGHEQEDTSEQADMAQLRRHDHPDQVHRASHRAG